jgi:hypothetical protein
LLTRASIRPWASSTAATVACTRLVADVGGVHRAASADGLDLALDRLELFQRAADDRHPRTERRQLVRGAAADARAAAGDESNLAGEQVGAENGAVGGHRRIGAGINQALAW